MPWTTEEEYVSMFHDAKEFREDRRKFLFAEAKQSKAEMFDLWLCIYADWLLSF